MSAELLLVLDSRVILVSETHGTHAYNLLFNVSGRLETTVFMMPEIRLWKT
jgi:hypothetical protein